MRNLDGCKYHRQERDIRGRGLSKCHKVNHPSEVFQNPWAMMILGLRWEGGKW